MATVFYTHKVFMKNGVEWTLLKYMLGGQYDATRKIEKPTADLTAADQVFLNEFNNGGGVATNKTDLNLPAIVYANSMS